MAQLLIDWLGPIIESELRTVIKWGLDSENNTGNFKRVLKNEERFEEESMSQTEYLASYEDDGTNLRANVQFESDDANTVQIYNVAGQNPSLYTISDSRTVVEAKVSGRAFEKFKVQTSRSAQDIRTGVFISITSLSIVASRHGALSNALQVLIQEFELQVSLPQPKIGHPRSIQERDSILPLLKQLRSLGLHQSASDPESSMQLSQDFQGRSSSKFRKTSHGHSPVDVEELSGVNLAPPVKAMHTSPDANARDLTAKSTLALEYGGRAQSTKAIGNSENAMEKDANGKADSSTSSQVDPKVKETETASWHGMTHITRKMCTVPKPQASVLSFNESWLPSDPGRRFHSPNLPIEVLEELNRARLKRRYIAEPTALNATDRTSPSQFHTGIQISTQPISSTKSNSEDDAGGLSEYEDSDRDDLTSWAESPEQRRSNLDNELPPDSPTFGATRDIPYHSSPAKAGSQTLPSSRSLQSSITPKGQHPAMSSLPSTSRSISSNLNSSKKPTGAVQKSPKMSQGKSIPSAAKRTTLDDNCSMGEGHSMDEARIDHESKSESGSEMEIEAPYPLQPQSSPRVSSLWRDRHSLNSNSPPELQTGTSVGMRNQLDKQMSPSTLTYSRNLAEDDMAEAHNSSVELHVHNEMLSATQVKSTETFSPSQPGVAITPSTNAKKVEASEPVAGISHSATKSVPSKRYSKFDEPAPLSKKPKPSHGFNFTQDSAVSQDPSIQGRQARQDFMKSLSNPADVSPQLIPKPDSTRLNKAANDGTKPALPRSTHQTQGTSPSVHKSLTVSDGGSPSHGHFLTSKPPNALPPPAASPSATESVAISTFNKFKAAYPDYKGDMKHFFGICKMISSLQEAGRMLHRFMWDDFIVRHKSEYGSYVVSCIEQGNDPQPYEKFYSNKIEEPQYVKRILNPERLSDILEGEKQPFQASSTKIEQNREIQLQVASTTPKSSLPTRKEIYGSNDNVNPKRSKLELDHNSSRPNATVDSPRDPKPARRPFWKQASPEATRQVHPSYRRRTSIPDSQESQSRPSSSRTNLPFPNWKPPKYGPAHDMKSPSTTALITGLDSSPSGAEHRIIIRNSLRYSANCGSSGEPDQQSLLNSTRSPFQNFADSYSRLKSVKAEREQLQKQSGTGVIDVLEWDRYDLC